MALPCHRPTTLAMLRSFLALPLAVLLAAAGCNGSQNTVSSDVQAAATGDPFFLELGDAVQVDGHSLRFVDVVEDSRCPEDVTCIWEGRAKVQIAASDPTGAEERQVLTLPYGSMGEDERSTWTVGGLVVRLHDLTPYPNSERPSEDPPRVELSVVSEG